VNPSPSECTHNEPCHSQHFVFYVVFLLFYRFRCFFGYILNDALLWLSFISVSTLTHDSDIAVLSVPFQYSMETA